MLNHSYISTDSQSDSSQMKHKRDICHRCKAEFAYVPYGLCVDCYDEECEERTAVSSDLSRRSQDLLDLDSNSDPEQDSKLKAELNLKVEPENKPAYRSMIHDALYINCTHEGKQLAPHCKRDIAYEGVAENLAEGLSEAGGPITLQEGEDWPLHVRETAAAKRSRFKCYVRAQGCREFRDLYINRGGLSRENAMFCVRYDTISREPVGSDKSRSPIVRKRSIELKKQSMLTLINLVAAKVAMNSSTSVQNPSES